ncbi:hypothetical protein QOZ96_001810 [Brevundimonas nasdae]|uniref:transglycosylase SLT domain-containing protein n=1 Tax=Brevundimonas nasdae TaxID=172043 RepID=UPI001F2A3CC7|nr:transglycosylase SLT domain-containing protein [Brevundimonas nasdae]MDQ0451861.1 hypothetical protein [Brevundimonas nasdae]
MRSLPRHAEAPPLASMPHRATPEPSTLTALDDQTLLGLLLGRCLAGSDVDPIAEALLDRFGSLGDIAAAEVSELGRLPGLGPTAILDLKLLRELSIRLARSAACARPVLSSWNTVLAYARTTLAYLPREQFRTLYLDRRNILLCDELVADGSAYRVDAVSPAGAGGLTQLMPGTAADLAVRDRFDPIENLNGGADYLARQLLRFGEVRLALAAYNSGPDRVARLGRIPHIAETQAYVASAVDCYLALTAGRGARNSRECRSPEPGR